MGDNIATVAGVSSITFIDLPWHLDVGIGVAIIVFFCVKSYKEWKK